MFMWVVLLLAASIILQISTVCVDFKKKDDKVILFLIGIGGIVVSSVLFLGWNVGVVGKPKDLWTNAVYEVLCQTPADDTGETIVTLRDGQNNKFSVANPVALPQDAKFVRVVNAECKNSKGRKINRLELEAITASN